MLCWIVLCYGMAWHGMLHLYSSFVGYECDVCECACMCECNCMFECVFECMCVYLCLRGGSPKRHVRGWRWMTLLWDQIFEIFHIEKVKVKIIVKWIRKHKHPLRSVRKSINILCAPAPPTCMSVVFTDVRVPWDESSPFSLKNCNQWMREVKRSALFLSKKWRFYDAIGKWWNRQSYKKNHEFIVLWLEVYYLNILQRCGE